MAIKQNVLIMTQIEHTFDEAGKWLGGRITKQWQTIPTNSPKPKKEVKSVFSKQAGVEEM